MKASVDAGEYMEGAVKYLIRAGDMCGKRSVQRKKRKGEHGLFGIRSTWSGIRKDSRSQIPYLRRHGILVGRVRYHGLHWQMGVNVDEDCDTVPFHYFLLSLVR